MQLHEENHINRTQPFAKILISLVLVALQMTYDSSIGTVPQRMSHVPKTIRFDKKMRTPSTESIGWLHHPSHHRRLQQCTRMKLRSLAAEEPTTTMPLLTHKAFSGFTNARESLPDIALHAGRLIIRKLKIWPISGR